MKIVAIALIFLFLLMVAMTSASENHFAEKKEGEAKPTATVIAGESPAAMIGVIVACAAGFFLVVLPAIGLAISGRDSRTNYRKYL